MNKTTKKEDSLLKRILIAHARIFIWLAMLFGILFIVVIEEAFRTAFGLSGESNLITDFSIMECAVYLGILFSSFIIMFWDYKKHGKYIKFEKDYILKYVLVGIGFNLICSIIISFFPENILAQYSETMKLSFNSASILGIALVAPIAEELVYRGIIRESLSIINPFYGVVVSSLLFALMHIHPIQMCYAFFMGMLCSIIDMNKKSLFPSIILHISINTMSVILYLTGLEKL